MSLHRLSQPTRKVQPARLACLGKDPGTGAASVEIPQERRIRFHAVDVEVGESIDLTIAASPATSAEESGPVCADGSGPVRVDEFADEDQKG